jgi:hypothetical protein
MNDDRDLRKLLRQADPAAGVELTPSERARMRAMVTSAARAGRSFWHRPAAFGWGAACVLALVAVLVALRSTAPGGREAASTPPRQETPPAAIVPRAPEPLTAPTSVAARKGPARPPAPAHQRLRPDPDDRVPTTRIVFTAPGGTRILWFGSETPAHKEDAT